METLNNAFDLYVCDLNRREKKTVSSMQRIWLRHIKDTLGKKNIKRIKHDQINDWFYEVSKSGNGIANRCLTILKCTFDIAMRYEMIEQNPCTFIKRHPDLQRKRYCNEDEMKRIFDVLNRKRTKDNQKHIDFIMLLIYTGCRKGELASAKWDDLEGNRIVLREHKTDDKDGDRVIHLNDQAMQIVNRLERKGSSMMQSKYPDKFWLQVREEAGVPDLRLHDLRHSFATFALRSKKVSLVEIGNLLGHKSPKTTMRYAHVMDETAKQNVNDVGNEIFNSIQSS